MVKIPHVETPEPRCGGTNWKRKEIRRPEQRTVFICSTMCVRISSRRECLQSCTDHHIPSPSQLCVSSLLAGTTLLRTYHHPHPSLHKLHMGTAGFLRDSWPLKMGLVGCPEMSAGSYRSSPRNHPEERSSHLLHCGSLKLCNTVDFAVIRDSRQADRAYTNFFWIMSLQTIKQGNKEGIYGL